MGHFGPRAKAELRAPLSRLAEAIRDGLERVQAAEEEERPERAEAAFVRLFPLFARRAVKGEGREPELQHLRGRQRAGQAVGRNGAGGEAALPADGRGGQAEVRPGHGVLPAGWIFWSGRKCRNNDFGGNSDVASGYDVHRW